jgi:hypothetical protein
LRINFCVVFVQRRDHFCGRDSSTGTNRIDIWTMVDRQHCPTFTVSSLASVLVNKLFFSLPFCLLYSVCGGDLIHSLIIYLYVLHQEEDLEGEAASWPQDDEPKWHRWWAQAIYEQPNHPLIFLFVLVLFIRTEPADR